tara:strand:- start:409 stop:693 length:285 start_codon:yes stop_codon:yes gene_type:complete
LYCHHANGEHERHYPPDYFQLASLSDHFCSVPAIHLLKGAKHVPLDRARREPKSACGLFVSLSEPRLYYAAKLLRREPLAEASGPSRVFDSFHD